MSNYPPGAFDALCRIHDQQEAYEMTFEQAKQQRIEELRKGGIVEYTTVRRTVSQSAKHLLEENLNCDLIREAGNSWLIGDSTKAVELFNAACEYALEQAADFLATCDAEVGEW